MQVHDGRGRAQLAAVGAFVAQAGGKTVGVQPGDDGGCLGVVKAGHTRKLEVSESELTVVEQDTRVALLGLTLHPEKTRLLPFGRPPARQEGGKGPGTFDFLGFTLYWGRARTGRWKMWCKTRSARLRRAVTSIADWCQSNRQQPVKAQQQALARRIHGHYNYFGVSGNFKSLQLVYEEARRAWYKWLRCRSQRSRMNWEKFAEILGRFPLPRPRITVRILGR